MVGETESDRFGEEEGIVRLCFGLVYMAGGGGGGGGGLAFMKRGLTNKREFIIFIPRGFLIFTSPGTSFSPALFTAMAAVFLVRSYVQFSFPFLLLPGKPFFFLYFGSVFREGIFIIHV